MEIARFDNGKVEVPGTMIAVIVAIITIIPGLVTSCTELLVKPYVERSTVELEKARINLEQRKALEELYRSALAIEDTDQRHMAIGFLLTAKLVDANPDVAALPKERIPHWPAAP